MLLPGGQQVRCGHYLLNSWFALRIERHPGDCTALRPSINNGAASWQQQVSSPGGAGSVAPQAGAAPNANPRRFWLNATSLCARQHSVVCSGRWRLQ